MAEDLKSCQECGASIYQEHLDRGLAGFVAGKLLCSVCRAKALGTRGVAAAPAEQGAAPASAPAPESGEESLRLVDESEVTTAVKPSSVQAQSAFGGPRDDSSSPRALSHQRNASRCRIFHTKITEGALVYLNDQINEWCERNPDVEIKFATSTVGGFEGKQHVEQHLIMALFY